MKTYIGLDDTDNHESRGTGRLARQIAEALAADFTIGGVTRHQLLVDERIPYTSHNSSACIHLDVPAGVDLAELFEYVKKIMLEDFQEGSDPGLCIAQAVPEEVQAFGRRAKVEVVDQAAARALAQKQRTMARSAGKCFQACG